MAQGDQLGLSHVKENKKEKSPYASLKSQPWQAPEHGSRLNNFKFRRLTNLLRSLALKTVGLFRRSNLTDTTDSVHQG